MRVEFLHDEPGYVGGAELTMREFAAAAPEGVEFVDEDADVTVVGNVAHPPSLNGRVVQYHHDVQHPSLPDAEHVFCSPLQRDRMKLEGECIPPALELDRYKRYANQNHRNGAVCVGRMAYGKGLELLAEYPEPIDVYSSVPISSQGSVRYQGPTNDVAKTLSAYETFVFLPTAIEPFGRAVVEAWAAGLELVVNRNVGALHWIKNDPEALQTAAEDFWALVTS